MQDLPTLREEVEILKKIVAVLSRKVMMLEARTRGLEPQ